MKKVLISIFLTTIIFGQQPTFARKVIKKTENKKYINPYTNCLRKFLIETCKPNDYNCWSFRANLESTKKACIYEGDREYKKFLSLAPIIDQIYKAKEQKKMETVSFSGKRPNFEEEKSQTDSNLKKNELSLAAEGKKLNFSVKKNHEFTELYLSIKESKNQIFYNCKREGQPYCNKKILKKNSTLQCSQLIAGHCIVNQGYFELDKFVTLYNSIANNRDLRADRIIQDASNITKPLKTFTSQCLSQLTKEKCKKNNFSCLHKSHINPYTANKCKVLLNINNEDRSFYPKQETQSLKLCSIAAKNFCNSHEERLAAIDKCFPDALGFCVSNHFYFDKNKYLTLLKLR